MFTKHRKMYTYMFHIDDNDIKKLEKQLMRLSKKSMPKVTGKTLNDVAFQSRSIAVADLGKTMITRNTWTKRSLGVNRSFGNVIHKQQSEMGSTEKYMEKQEFGGINRSRGKHGVTIPTSYAAGQERANPRTKAVRKPNRMQSIRLNQRVRNAKNRRQHNKIAVMHAAKTKQRFVFLELDRRKGIFKVLGTKKKPRVKMVQDMTKKQTRVPARPWLRPATDEAVRMLPGLYAHNLRRELSKFR